MPEGLSAAEVGKEIAHHHEHASASSRRDRAVSIAEAILLSLVALLAAWSGYSAAKWSTKSSVSLARASATRTKSSRADIEALQIRTLDSVQFNALFAAYESGNKAFFRIALRRLRPGYRVAVNAWLATHPLTNAHAPPGPSYMPQYHIAQQAQSARLDARADGYFDTGEAAAGTADKYVRLTVFLAAVLFLIGISSHFPVRVARYGLTTLAAALLILAVVQLLSLPGPPA